MKTAHKSAIISAFSTPKIRNTMKYKTKIINSSIDLSKLNMDIKYHTTISDYEKVLGVSYVGA